MALVIVFWIYITVIITVLHSNFYIHSLHYIHSFGLQFTLHLQFWIIVITVIITLFDYSDCLHYSDLQ